MENDKNPASNASAVEFKRRLDRDPDKGFEKLPSNGKVLVCSLRTALEESKLRIMRLRNENDKKDEIIEEERNFRLALEKKLEKYLVDLYDNPDVNAELHQRLPRAKKTGHLFQRDVGRHDSEHDAASESSDVEVGGLIEKSDMARKQPSVSQDPFHSDHQPKDAIPVDVMTTSVAAQQNAQNTTNLLPVPNSSQTMSGSFPPGVATMAGYPQYPHYVPMFSYYQPNPLTSTSMTSLASSCYLGLPIVTNKEVSQDTNQPQANPSPNHNPPPPPDETTSPKKANHMQSQTHPISDKPDPRVHTYFNSSDPNIPRGESGPFPQLNWNSIPTSLMGSGFINPLDRSDNVSHLTRLLQEISILKRENKELKEELQDHKRDLELLKMDANQEDGNKNTEAIAALIEEVKRAEKSGEMAVSQLIQSANEDRNVALQEMDRLRLRAAKRNMTLSSASYTDASGVGDTEENELADSSFSYEHEYIESERDESTLSSTHVNKLLERQREITKQQMEAVISQRDDALDKVSRLQKKLSSIKLSTFPGVTSQTLQAKLKITEKERDIAVGKLKLLSEDMNEVTLLYNLQKALLKNDVNTNYKSPPSSKWENKVDSNDNNTEAVLESPDKEKAKLKAAMKNMERENVEKDKRIEKLEELVLRQRKKLNTLCAGPLLMDD